MPRSELAHLELLAEIDTLVDRLDRWAESAPAWQPAEKCRALVRRLKERAASLRVRLDAPLVVATLGGTGTGKSALINAILGAEVVETGRSRPTTTRPTLVTRSGLKPEMLGIEPLSVQWIERDLPALRDLVLVDCPDPDTTEEGGDYGISPAAEKGDSPHLPERPGGCFAQMGTVPFFRSAPSPAPVLSSNLARLRAILPKCDVLLVTSTQQKYRSARVKDELAAAAHGAHVVFVQTHADTDDDIRADWRAVLAGENLPHIFRIDSLRTLADAQAGVQPHGDFAELLDLLTRQMAGAAGNRIRRANFLDLAADTLEACRARLGEAMPPVEQLRGAIDEQRAALSRQIVGEMQGELLAHRRQWENRLLAQTASRWGFSPFALVLRAYQGIGGLMSGALLYRARTPAQIALWGALEGVRTWRKRQQRRQSNTQVASAGAFDSAELRKAAIIVEGYASDAGLDRGAARWETIAAEAESAAASFVARVAKELEALIGRLAQRHAGWFTRFRYELLLLVMLGVVLYRLGKNFFYDSWWAAKPAPVYGIEFYLSAAFWLLLWCLLLLWAFSRRLRRGLRGEINRLAAGWQDGTPAAGLFAGVETQCKAAERFRDELETLRHEVDSLQRQLGEEPQTAIGTLCGSSSPRP